MKLTIFIFALIFGAIYAEFIDGVEIHQDHKDRHKLITAECVKDVNIDAALILAVDKGENVKSSDLNCFHKCYFIKYGNMDENGEFYQAQIKAIVPESQRAPLQKCFDDRVDDTCEYAYSFYKCYVKLQM